MAARVRWARHAVPAAASRTRPAPSLPSIPQRQLKPAQHFASPPATCNQDPPTRPPTHPPTRALQQLHHQAAPRLQHAPTRGTPWQVWVRLLARQLAAGGDGPRRARQLKRLVRVRHAVAQREVAPAARHVGSWARPAGGQLPGSYAPRGACSRALAPASRQEQRRGCVARAAAAGGASQHSGVTTTAQWAAPCQTNAHISDSAVGSAAPQAYSHIRQHHVEATWAVLRPELGAQLPRVRLHAHSGRGRQSRAPLIPPVLPEPAGKASALCKRRRQRHRRQRRWRRSAQGCGSAAAAGAWRCRWARRDAAQRPLFSGGSIDSCSSALLPTAAAMRRSPREAAAEARAAGAPGRWPRGRHRTCPASSSPAGKSKASCRQRCQPLSTRCPLRRAVATGLHGQPRSRAVRAA